MPSVSTSVPLKRSVISAGWVLMPVMIAAHGTKSTSAEVMSRPPGRCRVRRMGPAESHLGQLIRHWRTRRQLSQLGLAGEAGVSSRHVSFIETGRAKPSREMVLQLARALDVPLRDRNDLLTAAGFAPVYRATELDAPALAQARRALDFVLKAQEPYPALILDRHWNVLKVNEGGARVQAFFLDPKAVAELGPPNAMRLMFHPHGFRPSIVNWEADGGVARPVAAPRRGGRVRRRGDATPSEGAVGLSRRAAPLADARP